MDPIKPSSVQENLEITTDNQKKKSFINNRYFLLTLMILAVGVSGFLVYSFLNVGAGTGEQKIEVPRTWETSASTGTAPILEVILDGKLENKNPKLRIKEVRQLDKGFPKKNIYETSESTHSLEISDNTGKVLFTFPFNPSPISVAPPKPGTFEKPNDFRKIETFAEGLNLPWIESASTLTLKKSGVIIDTRKLENLKKSKVEKMDVQSLDGAKLENKASFSTASKAFAHNGKVHVAIIGDDYTLASLNKFDEDANKVIKGFKMAQPYKGRIGQFSFSKVRSTQDLFCYYYGRAILCDENKVYSTLNNSGIAYDGVIVVVNNSTYGGAARGGVGAVYSGDNDGYTPHAAIHEFTHIFGKITDEYLYYSTNGPLTNSIYQDYDYGYACYAGNPTYSGWTGNVALQDYAKGCIYPNYYRAAKDSLMDSFSPGVDYFTTPVQKRLGQLINAAAGYSPDTTIPFLNFRYPPNESIVSGTPTLTAQAYDVKGTTTTGTQITERVARVEIIVDGKLFKTLYAPTSGYDYTYSFPSTKFSNGTHTVTVRAYDGSERTNTKTKSIYIRN